MANILYPVFVLVLLTFIVAGWMAKERFGAMRRGEIKRGDTGIRPDWPGLTGRVSNAYHNLLEMPVLFYAVVAFAMETDGDTAVMILLAWIYVAFRIAQTLIHTTYNKILHRFSMFAGSVVTLALMWIVLFLHVSSASIR